MNILVIGSGGREHALVWKLRQSPKVQALYCAPGNAGIAHDARLVAVKPTDIPGLLQFAKEARIDLTVVGPEQPLVDGIVDDFERNGLRIFGPSRYAAALEGSKAFAKSFMAEHAIPTARFQSFRDDELVKAEAFIQQLPVPIVVKADGLAAGKGVLICEDRDAAVQAIRGIMLKKTFGEAGNKIVIEEYMVGEEASIFALTDGDRYAILASAQDHKRIQDGDGGKNTGGMGAYAPAPVVTPEILARVEGEIVEPTLRGMREAGHPYRGCLYCGLMITDSGPKVVEFNCRFGDPETQVVIPLIDGDLAEILLSVAEHRLDPRIVKQLDASAVCVVMASKGYPDEYETGKRIEGLDEIRHEDGLVVFHAGTRAVGEQIQSFGGRVLGVTAIGYSSDLKETVELAYRGVSALSFDGAYYRHDIASRALRRLAHAR